MSAKGKIAKMETGRKAVEVIAWIVEMANKGEIVCLKEDWGGNSLTVCLAKQSEDDGTIRVNSHTHVGFDDMEIDGMIENFHATVTGRGGLSWA